ncbi:hypothetical protein AK830_g8755 [Neonectria ditissima]|uniref:Uncharacterized protein n=1 Tax=Neonectria ditissima TaxID=78410 RepID=A0A0P7BBH8_9HYPO|nr:hypothetical protein AK830_g8755 [Neonectria ditissima]
MEASLLNNSPPSKNWHDPVIQASLRLRIGHEEFAWLMGTSSSARYCRPGDSQTSRQLQQQAEPLERSRNHQREYQSISRKRSPYYESHYFWTRYQFSVTRGDEKCTEERLEELQREAEKVYDQTRVEVAHVVRHAIRNLEVIVWHDKLHVPPEILIDFACSAASHVKFGPTYIDGYQQLERPLPPGTWPLRSLDCCISLADEFDTVGKRREERSSRSRPVTDFLQTLLQRCAPTLEKLTWKGFPAVEKDLRKTSKRIAEFIVQHRQNQKLCVHERDTARGDTAHLDQCIIPLLANGTFSNLRCLSLAWGGGEPLADGSTVADGTGIPETALAVIGTIASLEKLSLKSGTATGWRHQWLVDHDRLRFHLQGLRRLEILALSRDTYRPPDSALNFELYYQYRFCQEDGLRDAPARTILAMEKSIDDFDFDELIQNPLETDRHIWERAHRNRMLTQAEAYAVVLPALDVIICGQWKMKN